MRDGVGREAELRFLSELGRALAGLGVGVQVRDALPGLTVNAERHAPPGGELYVFVTVSGRHFEWRRAEHRHPVSDVQGAARRIAEFVRQVPSAARGRGAG